MKLWIVLTLLAFIITGCVPGMIANTLESDFRIKIIKNYLTTKYKHQLDLLSLYYERYLKELKELKSVS